MWLGNNKKEDKAILVIRSSAMGDVAMSSPVVAEFRRLYPDKRVVMLTRAFYAPFFEGIPNFEIFNVDLSSAHRGIMGTWKLYRELTKRYDIGLIVDLNDKLYSRLLRKFFLVFSGVFSFDIDKGRAQKKSLTRRNNKIKTQLPTSIERYCDAFAKSGYPLEIPTTLPKRQNRPFPEGLRAKALGKRADLGLSLDPRYLAIAPFAQHLGKRLPIETVYQILEMLGKRMPQLHVFVFGGGASERDIAQQMESRCGNVTSAIGSMTLEQEMDLMSNTELVVSMDSSSMHMGSLLGLDVISIWGATHPYAGFLGLGQSGCNVVQVSGLECRPCSVYGNKPCYRGDYACLAQIKADDVFSKIKEYMER